MQVNVLEAKTQLSKLIEAVLRGEEVVIANRGRPVVKLVPAEVPRRREWGAWEGRVDAAEIDAAFTPEADAEIAADLLGSIERRALRVAEPRPKYAPAAKKTAKKTARKAAAAQPRRGRK